MFLLVLSRLYKISCDIADKQHFECDIIKAYTPMCQESIQHSWSPSGWPFWHPWSVVSLLHPTSSAVHRDVCSTFQNIYCSRTAAKPLLLNFRKKQEMTFTFQSFSKNNLSSSDFYVLYICVVSMHHRAWKQIGMFSKLDTKSKSFRLFLD